MKRPSIQILISDAFYLPLLDPIHPHLGQLSQKFPVFLFGTSLTVLKIWRKKSLAYLTEWQLEQISWFGWQIKYDIRNQELWRKIQLSWKNIQRASLSTTGVEEMEWKLNLSGSPPLFTVASMMWCGARPPTTTPSRLINLWIGLFRNELSCKSILKYELVEEGGN